MAAVFFLFLYFFFCCCCFLFSTACSNLLWTCSTILWIWWEFRPFFRTRFTNAWLFLEKKKKKVEPRRLNWSFWSQSEHGNAAVIAKDNWKLNSSGHAATNWGMTTPTAHLPPPPAAPLRSDICYLLDFLRQMLRGIDSSGIERVNEQPRPLFPIGLLYFYGCLELAAITFHLDPFQLDISFITHCIVMTARNTATPPDPIPCLGFDWIRLVIQSFLMVWFDGLTLNFVDSRSALGHCSVSLDPSQEQWLEMAKPLSALTFGAQVKPSQCFILMCVRNGTLGVGYQ